MRDYVTCSKFTTKPRLYDIFSNFRCPRVVFTWVFLSSWLLWELVHDKIWILHPAKRGLVVIFARLMSSHIRAIPKRLFSLLFCTPIWAPWHHVKTENIRESFLMQGRERQESESLAPSKVVVTCTNCRLTVTRFFFFYPFWFYIQ